MGRGWKILIGVVVAARRAARGQHARRRGRNQAGRGDRARRPDPRAATAATCRSSTGGPRDGSPIVLIHCFTCAIDWWDGMSPAARTRATASSRSTCSASAAPKSRAPATRWKTRPRWSPKRCARLGVHDATVVGHSLGGTVATALAEVPGSWSTRLVIIDQAPDDNDYEKEGLPLTARLTFMPVIGPGALAGQPRLRDQGRPRRRLRARLRRPRRVRRRLQADDLHLLRRVARRRGRLHRRRVRSTSGSKRTGLPLLAIFGAEEQIYEPEQALAAYATGARRPDRPDPGRRPLAQRREAGADRGAGPRFAVDARPGSGTKCKMACRIEKPSDPVPKLRTHVRFKDITDRTADRRRRPADRLRHARRVRPGARRARPPAASPAAARTPRAPGPDARGDGSRPWRRRPRV